MNLGQRNKPHGEDGQVEVREKIDDNESVLVFNEFMDAGDQTNEIQCKGTPPKLFHWVHHATQLSDVIELDDGALLRVRS